MTRSAKAVARAVPRSPDARRASLILIEGGAPPEHEWTAAEITRLCSPKVKELRFVKLKPNAEPMWHPESYWNVPQSPRWKYEEAHALGKQFAVQAIAAMRQDGVNVLSHIFRDMIRAGVQRELERQKKGRREARRDPVMAGFLHQLGSMLLPSLD